MDVFQKLLDYEKRGFLFHGSPDSSITSLEPRPGIDHHDLNDPFGNDTAVFATILPKAAVAFAVMDTGQIPNHLIPEKGWGAGSEDGRSMTLTIPKEWKPYIIQGLGTVYILPSEGFVDGGIQGGWERKNYSTIFPVEKIPVQFADFEKLGGVIEWID